MPCVFCEKSDSEINPMRAVYVDSGIICSPECFQKQLDRDGMTIHGEHGEKMLIPPGKVKVSLTPDLDFVEKDAITITIDGSGGPNA